MKYRKFRINAGRGARKATHTHRIKVNWQLANEADVLMEVERERARLRQLSALTNVGNSLVQEPVPERANGQARDLVGAQLGVSGKTVDHLMTVKQAVDTLREAGDDDSAEELITPGPRAGPDNARPVRGRRRGCNASWV